jgi:hypothetical protein
MPTWAWVLSILLGLLGLLALGLLLFRFRYFLEWRGEWTGDLSGISAGTARIETRFLWYRHLWEPFKDASWSIADLFGEDDEDVTKPETEESAAGRQSAAAPDPEAGFSESASRREAAPLRPAAGVPEAPVFLKPEPAKESKTSGAADSAQGPAPEKPASKPGTREQKKADPHRKQRALFRLFTDRDAWKLLARYGLKTFRLVMKLLKPRIEAAIGHPDPALLGRLAGKWYAVRPLTQLLPVGRADLYFRFQDRHPSLWIRVQGTISLLSLLAFGIRLVVAFPFLLLARRALHGWRQHRLTGWRAWVYRKLQAG